MSPILIRKGCLNSFRKAVRFETLRKRMFGRGLSAPNAENGLHS